MLNKIILYLSLLLLPSMGILSTTMVYAEDKAIIGVIDWRGAIFSTNEAKKENARIQKQFKKDTQKIKSLESKISSTRKKLDKRKELLSEEQKKQLLTDLQKDVIEYQTLGQDVQQKIQAKEQEFIKKQTKVLQKIVEKISEERNLHVIMPIDAVIYGRLTIDITKEVVKELNGKDKKN